MLKSSVPVLLCSLTLIALPSAAIPATTEPGKNVTATTADLGVSSTREVSFALPSGKVKKFVASYIKDNDESLFAVKQRSARPFMIIDSVLNHYELPADLKYLAVIESDLIPTATSRVGARGPWQLMAGTARDLGLKVNGRSDERTSITKSTNAAALYLRDLHNQFKDWLLVLAAYNAGPLPVQRAIRLAGSRNFWALQRYLPKETQQHIKRFIATAFYFNVPEPPVPVDNAVCVQSLDVVDGIGIL